MTCAACGRLTWPGATALCTEGDMRVVEVSNDWVTWKKVPPGESRKKYRCERTSWRPGLVLVAAAPPLVLPVPAAEEQIAIRRGAESCRSA